MKLHLPSGHRNLRRGFGMVESVLSVALVGGIVAVAINTAGAIFSNRRVAADRIRGQLLASELMSEILAQEYEEPSGTVAFGPESGESTGNRLAFDDVDDYRNLVDSSPKSRAGAALTGFSNWSRTVTVVRADKNNLQTIALSESGIKRITVTVQYKGRTVASISSLRSGAILAAGKSQQMSETLKYIKKVNTGGTGAMLE